VTGIPKAIPDGLTQQHVLLALQDFDAGIEHPFGPPTGYELVHHESRYPPKAVVGIAFRHLTGSNLPHGEFSGGEAAGQVRASVLSISLSQMPDEVLAEIIGESTDGMQLREKLQSLRRLHGDDCDICRSMSPDHFTYQRCVTGWPSAFLMRQMYFG